MPIYEYQCSNCGHQLEALQKVTEEPLVECPECHHTSLNKLVSAAGFQLKGSGWYLTDYSDKGKPKESHVAKSPSDAAKTESKSEAKTETKADKGPSSSSSSSTTSTGGST